MASFFLETCCVKQSIYRSKNNVAECILEKYGVSGVGTTPKKKKGVLACTLSHLRC